MKDVISTRRYLVSKILRLYLQNTVVLTLANNSTGVTEIYDAIESMSIISSELTNAEVDMTSLASEYINTMNDVILKLNNTLKSQIRLGPSELAQTLKYPLLQINNKCRKVILEFVE